MYMKPWPIITLLFKFMGLTDLNEPFILIFYSKGLPIDKIPKCIEPIAHFTHKLVLIYWVQCYTIPFINLIKVATG